MIHPQALVHPDARIGENVEIGPYTVIGAGVEIGDGTRVGPHVVINGPTRIGKDNEISQFCSLGDAPQHVAYNGEPTRLEIGDRNVIREYTTFNRGTAGGNGVTRVGSENFIMAYCHVAHDCQVGDHTVFANGASLAGHVTVGDYVVFGGFTLVHQYCRLGEHCITAVGTVVYKDIPPYLVAAGYGAEPHGINIRGLRRRQFSESSIEALRRAYRILYKSRNRLHEAIEELEALATQSEQVARFVAFIKATKRGIVR